MSHYEDFGTSRVVDGHARVQLEPDSPALSPPTITWRICLPNAFRDDSTSPTRNSSGLEVREQKGGRTILAMHTCARTRISPRRESCAITLAFAGPHGWRSTRVPLGGWRTFLVGMLVAISTLSSRPPIASLRRAITR